MSDNDNPLLKQTEPYKTESGIWHHPVILKNSVNHELVAGSPMFVALDYHAQMTKWIENNVCRHCHENVGDQYCWCIHDD